MEIQAAQANPHSQTLFIPLSAAVPDIREGRRSGSEDQIPIFSASLVGPRGNCRVCEEGLTSETEVGLNGCDHKFCRDCLLEFLSVKLGERKTEELKCPSFGCNNSLQDAFLKKVMPQDMYSKFLRFRRYNELEQNVNFRWCPRPDCEGFDDRGNQRHLKLTCNECGFVFCFYCSEAWHASGKCRAEYDRKLDRWAKSHHAKFCPNCKVRVQKMKGCDHMTCFKCQYQWCWLCGEHYTPPHYDSCPVKRLRKLNPPWHVLLLLFTLPLLFPFALAIGAGFFIEEQIVKLPERMCCSLFLRRRYLSYPVLVTLALMATPLVLVLVILFAFAGVLAEYGRYLKFEKNCIGSVARRRCLWVLISITLGISLAPVAAAILAICVGLAPVAALYFVLQKGAISLIRCCRPNFMKPNIVPGYALG